jgi:hypothetical protein
MPYSAAKSHDKRYCQEQNPKIVQVQMPGRRSHPSGRGETASDRGEIHSNTPIVRGIQGM